MTAEPIAAGLPGLAMWGMGGDALREFARWMHGHPSAMTGAMWRRPTKAERRTMCGATARPFDSGGQRDPYAPFRMPNERRRG